MKKYAKNVERKLLQTEDHVGAAIWYDLT